jgi:hypothetical protein
MYCAIGKKYLEAFWSDMFKLKKKRDRQKNSKKNQVLAHNLFRLQLFDLEFSLKRFWTGPPVEILPSSSEAYIRHYM